ncbi:MAG: hypothetical protein DMG55_22960 [Acidobacteria bacterium]|nr:MAG: hypothetical protein DMG55_22960 [Acidobacteriota bacterium]
MERELSPSRKISEAGPICHQRAKRSETKHIAKTSSAKPLSKPPDGFLSERPTSPKKPGKDGEDSGRAPWAGVPRED